MALWNDIRADYRRYRLYGASAFAVIISAGFIATLSYRFCRVWYLRRALIIYKITKPVLVLGSKFIEFFTKIELPAMAEIGPGLCVFHNGPTIVNARAVIGANCNLRPGVVIGSGGRGETAGAPTIGDRAEIGVNSVIIGPITLGDDCVVGAGAVVVKSAADRAVLVGNPARAVSNRGSFPFILYPGMEHDLARQKSLAECNGDSI